MEPVFRTLEIAASTAVRAAGTKIIVDYLIGRTGAIPVTEATISHAFESKDFKNGAVRMSLVPYTVRYGESLPRRASERS
ncbi:hypothetical protein OG976_12265 [Mycobacterium sp. NBC_00419]|uniref:hypothetical protein n=1 Tax=Mycobacterium sp. NBC_00419 TaxID=2975989 RepID=UPI002E20E8A5